MNDIHTHIEDWMAAAVCGGLDAREQQLFQEHLAQCPACRALFQEEQAMNTLLEQELGAQRPGPELADRMVRRVRARLDAPANAAALLAALRRIVLARPMQLAYAVLLLAAMVKSGSMITGERPPGISTEMTRPVAAIGSAGGADTDRRRTADDKFAMNTELKEEGILQPGNRPVGAPAFAGRTDMPRSFAAPAPGDAVDSLVAAGATRHFGWKDTAADGSLAAAAAPAESGEGGAAAGAAALALPVAEPQPGNRKLIRDASVQVEVADYAKAAASIGAFATGEGGYISTQSSNRGANGKLQGSIEIKLPPERLDDFLGKLRGLGDVKSQNLTTQDVTKDYFDTGARMRNAQVEEARLIEIVKNRTGKLSDVLEVERELARVRESIEQMQGTLKYYDAMVQFATVTIALNEKDLNTPAQYLLKQRADLSLYSKDVDAAFARARQIAASAQAQVLDSNVQRDDAGRTTATLSLLINPDAAESALGQLKDLGRIENFTSATQRIAQGGSDNADGAVRTERDKVEAHLTILKDEENSVQQTEIGIQTADIEARIAALKKNASDMGAEVKGASFQSDPSGAEFGTVQLRMPLRAYAGVLAAVKHLGEVKNLSTHRQEGATVSDNAPAEMTVQLFTEPQVVTPDDGLWATIRRTLGEAAGAVAWSVRMIGVSLAFFAPWLLLLGVAAVCVKLARRLRRKS